LRSARKVLKTDGKLIISTPNVLSLKSRLKFLLSGYFPWFTPDCFEYHVHPIPYWQLGLVADQTNLKIKNVRGNGDYFFSSSSPKLSKSLFKNEEIIVTLEPKL